MSIQTLEKQGDPRIVSVDRHAGYAEAKKKMAEIVGRVARATAELEEKNKNLAETRASQVDREAGAVLEGKRPTNEEIRLTREAIHLRDNLEVLARSAGMQRERMKQQLALATEEVMATLRPEYKAAERKYFLALVELGKTVEVKFAWAEKARLAGVRPQCGGLSFGGIEPFASAVGAPQSESMLNFQLDDAVRRGVIGRQEVPQNWKFVRGVVRENAA